LSFRIEIGVRIQDGGGVRSLRNAGFLFFFDLLFLDLLSQSCVQSLEELQFHPRFRLMDSASSRVECGFGKGLFKIDENDHATFAAWKRGLAQDKFWNPTFAPTVRG